MLVSKLMTKRPEMGNTRTYQDFSAFLGKRPDQLGLLSRLYPENTITFLTEALGNIWSKDNKKGKDFKPIESLVYEWEIETNEIKRVPMAAAPVRKGSDLYFYFSENYYQIDEYFKVDDDGEQFAVIGNPLRISDALYEVPVQAMADDYSTIDVVAEYAVSTYAAGTLTRFIANRKPEMSDCGFVKYQSSTEKMRNYITQIRVEDSKSDRYALMEDKLISIAKGEGNGQAKEVLFNFPAFDETIHKNFLAAREGELLFGKSTVNVDGQSTWVNRSNGRPIIGGDGLIAQVSRFASKYAANNFTVNTFQQIITQMVSKCDKPEDNTFIFICNPQLFGIVQRVLFDYLAHYRTDGAWLWSKDNQGKVKVGATFNSYTYMNNTIIFKMDRTLEREYKYPFGLCLDLTSGSVANGHSPIELLTVKGAEYIPYELNGPGKQTGRTGGEVSTLVAGSVKGIMGYCGVLVANPYKSFIVTGQI